MAGILFQGMNFEISADGVTYTSVGCVTGYSLDGSARAEIETTCNSSTAKEYVFGLRDFGALSLDVNYDPDGAGLAIVEASYASDTPYHHRITYSNTGGTSGTLKDFEGTVMNISENGSLDDKIAGTFEIKVSGAITKTPAA